MKETELRLEGGMKHLVLRGDNKGAYVRHPVPSYASKVKAGGPGGNGRIRLIDVNIF